MDKEIKNIENKVNNLKSDLQKELDDIEKMGCYKLKTLCIMALLEQYAQSYNDEKKKSNSQKFTDFVSTFSKNKIIKLYDPVTLSYEYNRCSKNAKYDLALPSCERPIHITNDILKSKVRELESLINSEKALNCTRLLSKHQIVALLYRYRCKLSHEFKSPSVIWEDEQALDVPFVTEVTIIGEKKRITRWELRLPYKFIKNIITDTVNNYLDNCIQKGVLPFSNNQQYLDWYEN